MSDFRRKGSSNDHAADAQEMDFFLVQGSYMI
jgi:hypothetical protein